MGYPVAYRRGARLFQGPGFQGGLKEPPGSGWPNPMKQPYTRPPRPDNDPFPVPDNDNIPGRGRPDDPPLPSQPAWPGFPAEVADEAMRLLLPPPISMGIKAATVALDWHKNWQRPPVVDWPGTGWWVECGPVTPSPAYEGPYKWHAIDSGRFCGLGLQALGDGLDEFPQQGPTSVTLAKRTTIGGTEFRWQIIQSLHSVLNPPLPVAVHDPYTVVPRTPWTYPEPVQWPDPGVIELPKPDGYSVPEAPPMPATMPRSRTAPRPNRVPGLRPGRPFAPMATARPGRATGSNPAPTVVVGNPNAVNPVRRPPGKGEKERKARATGAFEAFNGMLSAASGVYEDAKFAFDLVKAFYDALPNNKGAKTPQAMLAELYRRWNEVDVEKAIWGVLQAVAGEKAGAYIDRARSTAARNLGLNLNITIPTGSAPYVR